MNDKQQHVMRNRFDDKGGEARTRATNEVPSVAANVQCRWWVALLLFVVSDEEAMKG